jgi:hypothetical protein
MTAKMNDMTTTEDTAKNIYELLLELVEGMNKYTEALDDYCHAIEAVAETVVGEGVEK